MITSISTDHPPTLLVMDEEYDYSPSDTQALFLLSAYSSPDQQPTPALRKIFDDPNKGFLIFQALERQAKLLTRRKEVAVGSEDIAELSIYDKALLALYSRCGGEEKRLSAPGCWGLFNFFLDHFVGIDRLASHEPANQSPPSEKLAVKDAPNEVQKTQSTCFDRMIEVYQIAKLDCYLTDANKNRDKFQVVRFLRDTAENLLTQMLNAGYGNHPLVPELRQVYEVSKSHAEQLSGGRKRPFEVENLHSHSDGHPAGGYPSTGYPTGGITGITSVGGNPASGLAPSGYPSGSYLSGALPSSGSPSARYPVGAGYSTATGHKNRRFIDSYRPVRE
ncbi:hypothetical protein N7510_007648 [Penicillium lagena]|uniref:uncharacterized protein n=1 Tax=Penicillium lagena TaxID=94218 RepID=UPI002540006C|nr:uncharacterized protein N7510_007648 [Penicillium lagena]KAJ5610929.1 hypothetical protein N7510_007648 [Penicillium lagena]